MINERREQMKQKDFVSGGDFLTILLMDDLFMENEEYMVDECVGFMLASTTTTTILLYNTLYFLTANPKIGDKVRAEIKSVRGADTDENWKKMLGYEELDKLNYTYLCL